MKVISIFIINIWCTNSYSFVPSVRLFPHRLFSTPLYSTTTGDDIDTNLLEQGGCTVGDTRGAALLLSEVSIRRGPNLIIDDINWRVERNERWGIVGANGAGKSTLLNGITGTIDMDIGSKALIASRTRVGYLRQTAIVNTDQTVFEEASSQMIEIRKAQEEIDRATERIESGDTSDKALTSLENAHDKFRNVGGFELDQKVETVLRGLGFRDGDSKRKCTEFSGGWQMRIGIAKLLLSAPEILLLDEPSNHLDSSARDWLGKYLANYKGTIILVSHDINLLSASVNSIAEVVQPGGSLQTYVSCTYDQYLEQKEFRGKAAAAEYEKNLAEAEKLQKFIDKFGASATKASQAQSRVKMLEKMKKEGKLDAPSEDISQVTRFKPTLILPPPAGGTVGDLLLGLSNAKIGYRAEDKKDKELLNNINLEITRGMKLILRGKNGAGKSTLMKALTKKQNVLLSGDRTENEGLRIGTFTQDLAQQLPVDAKALDIVLDHARTGQYGDIQISNQDARNVMGQLGLSGDKPLRLIKDLSGGEKARVALSMFSLKASNLLLLDEPSNHLDIECIDALSEALSAWGKTSSGKKLGDGAIVVVSHDREFCERVGFTHVGTVENGKLVIEERGLRSSDWDIYGMQSDHAGSEDASQEGVSTVELTSEEKAAAAKLRKEKLNAPKKIAKIEQSIGTTEEKIAELDDEMMKNGNDVGKLVELSEKKQKLESDLEEMMEEWEYLLALIE